MGSGGLSISVNKAFLVLFFGMTALTSNQVIYIIKVALDSFSAVMYYIYIYKLHETGLGKGPSMSLNMLLYEAVSKKSKILSWNL